jgi:hypothetical protein
MHQKYGSGAPKIWIRCAQNILIKLEGAEVAMQLRGLGTWYIYVVRIHYMISGVFYLLFKVAVVYHRHRTFITNNLSILGY